MALHSQLFHINGNPKFDFKAVLYTTDSWNSHISALGQNIYSLIWTRVVPSFCCYINFRSYAFGISPPVFCGHEQTHIFRYPKNSWVFFSCCLKNYASICKKKKLFKDGAPLQLTHADLCGPFLVRGLTTEKYYLTIMDDDFSKWFQAIPLNAK